jgi:hypothetical protein
MINSKREFVFRSGPYSKRRVTVVAVAHEEDRLNTSDRQVVVSYGYSVCCPKDQFNKKQGVRIARGRLLKHPLGTILSLDDDIDFYNKTHMHFI